MLDLAYKFLMTVVVVEATTKVILGSEPMSVSTLGSRHSRTARSSTTYYISRYSSIVDRTSMPLLQMTWNSKFQKKQEEEEDAQTGGMW
jgi:hypothetical protein